MKRLRDLRKGAALGIAALVMLAGAVAGREDPAKEGAVPVEPAPPAAATAATDPLDLEPIKRTRQETPPPDLFTPRLPPQPVAVAAAKPAPPPAPSAPPLPFKYLGRMIDGDKATVFLDSGQRSLAARTGETLEGGYLVESIGHTAIQFVYLPLGSRQSLAIPAQN